LDTTFCESPPEREIWRAFAWCDKNTAAEEEREEEELSPSLGELIFGFFWFYGEEFNFKKACSTTKVTSAGTTPVYGRLLSKRKRWGLKTKPWRVSVEDPFEDWHDLGQVVNEEGQAAIEKELKRAANLLANGASVAMLLDPAGAPVATPYKGGGRRGKGKGAEKNRNKNKRKQTPRKRGGGGGKGVGASPATTPKNRGKSNNKGAATQTTPRAGSAKGQGKGKSSQKSQQQRGPIADARTPASGNKKPKNKSNSKKKKKNNNYKKKTKTTKDSSAGMHTGGRT
jgi:hypothetical protein